MKKDEEKKDDDQGRGKAKRGLGGRRRLDYKAYSPDRKRYVFAQKHNLYLAEEGKEAEAVQLTNDGEEDYSFSSLAGPGCGRASTGRTDPNGHKIPTSDRKVRPNVTWSPDSKAFFVTRTDSRGIKDLFLVDSLAAAAADADGATSTRCRARTTSVKSELFYCDAAAKKITKVNDQVALRSRTANIHWGKTGDELRFVRRDRLQRHLEFCSLNTKTRRGQVPHRARASTPPTWTSSRSALRRRVRRDDLVVASAPAGATSTCTAATASSRTRSPAAPGGPAGSSTSMARTGCSTSVGNGREPGENIYYNHLYRVRFDGTDLTLLDPSDVCFCPTTRRAAWGPTTRRTCRRRGGSS